MLAGLLSGYQEAVGACHEVVGAWEIMVPLTDVAPKFYGVLIGIMRLTS